MHGLYVSEMKRLLLPSLAEILAVIVGFALQHIALYSYHKKSHNYSVVHFAIAISHLAKLATLGANVNFWKVFIIAIVLQFVGLAVVQFLGWICREICKANDCNFSPIPLKIIEVLLTLTSYLADNLLS